MFKVEAQVSSPFYVSFHTPRLVHKDALIWELIFEADVDGVGVQYSIRRSNSGQDRAPLFKFLLDAGADPEFCIGRNASMKMLLAYASLETLIQHPDAVFAHQVKTSPVAVDLCQSIFHMDAIDVVEDYLEWQGIQSDSNPVAAALFGHSSSMDITLSDIFRRLTGWTPLEYAAIYHPNHADSLLQRGEDATMGAPVAEAADLGNLSIIKPLVEAGARVNAYNRQGMTALHYACRWLNIDTLKTLIQCAEHKIDWEARTRDGRNLNALQLAEASPCHARRSTSKVQELLDILRAHIPETHEELNDGDEPVRMPGRFGIA
ncbi:hypothetical protein BC835DRAFT_154792 [Cytidiella melzeri]|nr:hypothetical protein BC835DRAFT_154792 [Cytidiella melzeri]